MKKVAIIGNGVVGKLAHLHFAQHGVEPETSIEEIKKSVFQIETIHEIEYPDTYLSGKDKRRIRRAAERKANKKRKL